MKTPNTVSEASGQPSLRRVLGVPDGVAILVGITIEAGIYSTPQIIAGYMSFFAWIISLWVGVGAFVFVGLIYAELGTVPPIRVANTSTSVLCATH